MQLLKFFMICTYDSYVFYMQNPQFPQMRKIIPYGRQHIDSADIRAVKQALESDFLTTGPRIREFEEALCQVTGAKQAVVCTSGTAALHLACLALGVKKGDLGLTTPITFLASANCVEYCGGRVDFVDVDPETQCFSAEALEEYCRTRRVPRLVIPVDYAGIPCDLPRIRKLSDKFGFRIIEDAAHSLGSVYPDGGISRRCGACIHSDMAILSFHPVKTITTGEGGAVLTNDSHLADKLRVFRSHGMVKTPAVIRKYGPWYYEMQTLGYHYRITDLQCALGVSQLKKLSVFKRRRTAIVQKYQRAFSGNPRLILPHWPEGSNPCFHLYPVQFAGGSKTRRKAYDALAARGIQAQVHYIPVYRQPYYARKYGYAPRRFPNAELFYSRCVSLPLFPGLTDGEIKRISDIVNRIA
jgi:perosamine synthetase